MVKWEPSFEHPPFTIHNSPFIIHHSQFTIHNSVVVLGRRESQAVTLEPPIKRAAAQAQGLGGFADVALEAGEGLLDEEALDFLQAHILQARRSLASTFQAQVGR